jgi:hypothetical protein
MLSYVITMPKSTQIFDEEMVKEYNPDVPGIIQILWIIINSKV